MTNIDEARREGFVPSEHINAKAHKAVMERMENMTPEEFLDVLVRAGTHTPDGKLTEHYRDDEDENQSAPINSSDQYAA